MWELDHKEGWAPKNWCFWTVVLEKTLASPLDSMEIKPVSPNGNQPWIFIGRTDADHEAPIFDYLMERADSLEKPLMLGKIEGRRRREWHRMRWLDGITDSIEHESEQALGDGEQQINLVCCSPWGYKQSDMTEWQNNNNTHSMDISKLWKIVKGREAWHTAVHGVAKSQTQLSDWTTITQVSQWLRICLPM